MATYGINISGRDDFTRLCHMRFGTAATTFEELDNAYTLIMSKFTSDITGIGWDKKTLNFVDVISPGTPEADSNKDVGMTIWGVSAKNSKLISINIPSPNMTLINSDGTVDMTNTALMEYLALYFESGPLRVSDGEAVVRWLYGKMDED